MLFVQVCLEQEVKFVGVEVLQLVGKLHGDPCLSDGSLQFCFPKAASLGLCSEGHSSDGL